MSRKAVVSLRDVAREAKLSVCTVSRVLREAEGFPADTRQRVMQAAKKLSYRPNMLMRGVRMGKTMTIGVLLPIDLLYAGQVAAGAYDHLAQSRYMPILAQTHGNPRGVDEVEQVRRLVEHRVDGVIIFSSMPAHSDAHLQEIQNRGLPVVTVDFRLAGAHVDFAGTDDEQVGRLAAEYLLGKGHNRLGHLAASQVASSARARRESFERTVRAAGAELAVYECPSFGTDVEGARQLLRHELKPTAIFAASDTLARGLYLAAAQEGMSIPRDVSVVGCADMEFGPWLTPPLTTLDQQPRLVGKAAAELLLSRLSGRHSGEVQQRLIPARLVERASVKDLHSQV